MMFAAFVFLQPFLRGYLLDEPYFLNDQHQEIYLINMIPCFMLYMLNLVLYNCMSLILHNKMRYAQTIYCMMDSYARQIYPDVKEMPQVNVYCAENIDNIIQLSMILTKINEVMYSRTLVFCSVITLV
jgi:hypothetical protein